MSPYLVPVQLYHQIHPPPDRAVLSRLLWPMLSLCIPRRLPGALSLSCGLLLPQRVGTEHSSHMWPLLSGLPESQMSTSPQGRGQDSRSAHSAAVSKEFVLLSKQTVSSIRMTGGSGARAERRAMTTGYAESTSRVDSARRSSAGSQQQAVPLAGPPQRRAAEAECLGFQWVPLILGHCCGSRGDLLCALSTPHPRGSLGQTSSLRPSNQAQSSRGSSCVLRAYMAPTMRLPTTLDTMILRMRELIGDGPGAQYPSLPPYSAAVK